MQDRIDLEESTKRSQERARREHRTWYFALIVIAIPLLMILITPMLLDRIDRYIEQPDGNLLTILLYIALLVSIPIIMVSGVVTSLWMLSRAFKQSVRDKYEAGEVLQQALPDIPSEKLAMPAPAETLPGRKRVEAAVLVMLPILVEISFMVGVCLLLIRLWPDVSVCVYGPMVIALFWLGSPLAQRAWFATRPSEPTRQLLPLEKEMRQRSLQALLLVLFGAAGMIVGKAGFGVLGLVGLILLCLVGMFVFSMGPVYWVLGSVKRADYDGALRRVKSLQRIQPNKAAWAFLEGAVLDYAGHYEEADRLFKVSMIEEQRSVSMASLSQGGLLENHAFILLKRGMYEEAQKALEASIALRPDGSGPYNGLAECYLRQGSQAQRALELVETALHNKGISLRTRFMDRFRWAEYWGNKAWALALMGSHAEAEKALDTAFRMAPRDFKAEMAMLYYRAAQVARLQGDNLKARELLEQGSNLDPQGGAGRLVATALKEL